nr:hypothetical protein [Bacilli bacterium]
MERYDRVGRLDPNGEYDVSGNVLEDLVNGTSVSGTYDRVGRLDPNGEYDASGNVIGKEKPKTEETVKKVEEDSEKKKYKLYFPKFIKVVGTSATLAAATAATIFSVKYTGNVQKYENLKEDNNLRTSSMFDLVNQNTTSLDELLNQNLQEYQKYENFRDLINARRRFLTSKMEMIENYPTYYVDYNSLSVEKISNLDDSFFEYYSRYQLNPSDT